MIEVFPDKSIFKRFIQSIKNENNIGYKSNHKFVIVQESSNASDELNNNINIPEKRLYYDANLKITLSSIVKKIASSLNSFGHKSSEQICLTILYCLSYLPKKDSSIELLNEFFNNHTNTQVDQFAVYSLNNHYNFDYEFGSFTVGTFDSQLFNELCKKTLSDYHIRYKDRHKGKLAIKKKQFSSVVLDWSFLLDVIPKELLSYYNESMNCYFENLSNAFWLEFQNDFNQDQWLQTFYLKDYINLESWSNLLPTNITIFSELGKSRNGWVVPKHSPGYSITFGNVQHKYEILLDKLGLQEDFLLELYKNPTLKTFLNFCSDAVRYEKEGKNNVAFLHLIIALDLVFGEKGSSVKSVSQRCAICTYKNLQLTFENQDKNIRNLYDIRSKYVHLGIDIPVGSFVTAYKICKIVSDCLITLSVKTSDFNYDNWIKRVDILIARELANENIKNTDFYSLGIDINNT